MMYNAKNSLLPPKSPFPIMTPSSYVHTAMATQKGIPVQKPNNHQRTSSESFLMDEQPSWLDDLLNEEPDTPVRRGAHRRSSSDSFAYLDAANLSSFDHAFQNSWGPHREFNQPGDGWRAAAFYADSNLSTRHNSQARDASPARKLVVPSPRESNVGVQHMGTMPQGADGTQSLTSEKRDPVESGPVDSKSSAEKKESKTSASESDTKRAKQQFAQRSRVRKLQYIAELERNVQALQAEGCEVSAELEFLNQRNLIMNMENKALKQRLESLAQEQLIKYFEQEVLERERGRLRSLYQQQQQQNKTNQQQASTGHRRTTSRDRLDQQFSNLSLKNKEAASSDHEPPISGQLQT
ncbi:unnamed protein product [Cuscuta campestris]|uniref:BZIP domain-containing protein n=1 Tax=Cuscuta campestris TaxID=132261 RepID=A0A484MNJ9_9ASTE|nr:unnamed protein product [Cuscuta campestris]